MNRKSSLVYALTLGMLLMAGCAEVLKLIPELGTTISRPAPGSGGLTTEEVIRGLKEALTVGAGNAAGLASRVDGFNLNTLIRIPFPPEAITVKNAVEKVGLHELVRDFELSLNRAAEEAAKTALPVFGSAITGMSFSDAMGILRGADDAATLYLRRTTYDALVVEFTPIVRNAVQKVSVTRYWNPVVSAYNKTTVLTGERAVNPDLDQYITRKALDGLFVLVAQEEAKIRRDPLARVTEILRRVFGAR